MGRLCSFHHHLRSASPLPFFPARLPTTPCRANSPCSAISLAKTRENAWVYQSTRQCLPCVTYLMRVFCVHSVIDQPPTGTSGVARQGRRHGPSITYKITPSCQLDHSPPASQAGHRVGQALYSLRPHWLKLSEDQMLAINHCEFSLSAPN